MGSHKKKEQSVCIFMFILNITSQTFEGKGKHSGWGGVKWTRESFAVPYVRPTTQLVGGDGGFLVHKLFKWAV